MAKLDISKQTSLACLTVIFAFSLATKTLAEEWKVNDDLSITTNVTTSAGLSLRTEGRSSESIYPGNGAVIGVAGAASSASQDDGTLNFDKGDVVTAPILIVADAEFNYRDDFGFFIRGKAVYDAALENHNANFGHAPNGYTPGARLNDGSFNTLAQFTTAAVLDAFAFGEVELGDIPIELRGGRQVVSWGEGVFIRNGINSINPVDVTAFRRPGVQIKEGLLPLGMVYANAGVSDSVSIEGFWNFEWQQTQLDGCGTFFSTADIAAEGCNQLSLAPLAGNLLAFTNTGIGRLNAGITGLAFGIANNDAATVQAVLAALGTPIADPDAALAAAPSVLSYLESQLVGAQALSGALAPATNDAGAATNGFFLRRGPDRGPADFDVDNFGISTRYFADEIDTEFGLYYTRLDSRAPIVSYTSGTALPLLGGIFGTALPQAAIGPSSLAATYNIEYPENISTFGISAATNLLGLAVAGELSYRPNQPVQINTNDLTLAVTGLSELAGVTNPADKLFSGAAPGTEVAGFIESGQIRGQVSAVAFLDRMLGADRVTVVGEAGFEWLPDLNKDNPLNLNLGRASIYGNPNSVGNKAEGLTTQFSTGLRSRISAAYTNVFAGVNMTPSLSVNHDVSGYSSDKQFIEGRTTLGFGLSFDYLNRWTLALNYTTNFGGAYNGFDDRDFASAVVTTQF